MWCCCDNIVLTDSNWSCTLHWTTHWTAHREIECFIWQVQLYTHSWSKGVEGRTLHLHVDWDQLKQGHGHSSIYRHCFWKGACLLAAKQDGIKEMSITFLSNYPILFSGSEPCQIFGDLRLKLKHECNADPLRLGKGLMGHRAEILKEGNLWDPNIMWIALFNDIDSVPRHFHLRVLTSASIQLWPHLKHHHQETLYFLK